MNWEPEVGNVIIWKPEVGNVIIWHSGRYYPLIAKVIDQDDRKYCLLFLDGSSGWRCGTYIKRYYRKAEISADFFNLFVTNEYR